jgi:hypothetical protein
MKGARPVRILATGVLLDEYPDHEAALFEQVHRHGTHLSPEERGDIARARTGEVVFLRATAFVEFDRGAGAERWEDTPQGPFAVAARESATSVLLEIVERNPGLENLLGDFGISGLPVSRFQFAAAPRRIDIDLALAGHLKLD